MGALGPESTTRVAGHSWPRPPAALFLDRDDVHVWRVRLDAPLDVVTDLVALLSDEEKAKLGQGLGGEAGRHFVESHGALRRILSWYLNSRPEQLCFVADARGKPYLASPAGPPAIHFNLSHSGALALCAVTRGRDVGVDVERIRPVSAWREIAARYFSRREFEVLCAWPDDRALEAFFWGWTRKEAYSKALGQGVSRRWTQFSVPLTAGVVTELPDARLEAEGEGRFTLCPLAPGPGYVAAVTARGTGWHLRCWQWDWAKRSERE